MQHISVNDAEAGFTRVLGLARRGPLLIEDSELGAESVVMMPVTEYRSILERQPEKGPGRLLQLLSEMGEEAARKGMTPEECDRILAEINAETKNRP